METRPTHSLELLLASEQARFERAILSHNTRTGYDYDFRLFRRWAERMGRESLPATSETVSLFLTDQLTAGKKVATAVRRTSAITHMHRTNGLDTPVTPEIHRLLKGARRLRGEQPREMRPLSVAQLREISELLTRRATPLAMRNKAILVVGFASALRRSSIAALNLADVEYCAEGLVLRIGKEKQDQEGKGRYIGLPAGASAATDPVRCLAEWTLYRGDAPGALFTPIPFDRIRHIRGEAICRMIKSCVRMIGLNARDFGGHSLRAGFVTAAGESGASDLLISTQTGHRSMAVLRHYFRRSDLFKSNACACLGL